MFCRSLCGDTPAGSEGANLAAAESEQREVERPATQLRRMCRDVPKCSQPRIVAGEKTVLFFPSLFAYPEVKKKRLQQRQHKLLRAVG